MARTGDAPDGDAALERLRPLAGVHEYPSRVKCATLPWHALMAALEATGRRPVNDSPDQTRSRAGGVWTPDGETPPQPDRGRA